MAARIPALTPLVSSTGSSESVHPRRRLRVLASPLKALRAAASGTVTVSHAASSPWYAAWRTAGSGSVARPRTTLMGDTSGSRPGTVTVAVSREVMSACSLAHARPPVRASWAARSSSASLIWWRAAAAPRSRA